MAVNCILDYIYRMDYYISCNLLGGKNKPSIMRKKKTVNTWNHRIMVSEHKGEKFFEIHEVHYKDGVPDSYTADAISVHGDSLSSIGVVLNMMITACDKPALWKGKRWPQEYTGKIPKLIPQVDKPNLNTIIDLKPKRKVTTK